MTEMHDIARHLLDHVTTAGGLTEAEWLNLKQQHCVLAEQIEPTLVLTLQNVLVLANEIQAEANRLTVVLATRGLTGTAQTARPPRREPPRRCLSQ